MNDDVLALLQAVGSPSRFRILALLQKGVDHPEDLAERLDLRRQSVDKQLLELYGWGLVDRSAVFPADGRPRIVYRVSEPGQSFLQRVSQVARDFRQETLDDYARRLAALEDKLASGDLDEKAYLSRRAELEARYRRFLPDDEP